jgi:hypothetical protein
MGRRIASQSKQTVRGGPKPAKVGLHRRLCQYRHECRSNVPRIYCMYSNRTGNNIVFTKLSSTEKFKPFFGMNRLDDLESVYNPSYI